MNHAEADQFNEILQATMEVYGGRISAAALKVWWNALEPYGLPDVQQALSAHVQHSVFAPKPADVIGYLQALDGRPGVEEAWTTGKVSGDESETVVWTDEIAQAMDAARPLLQDGDEVAARMAFKERYQALVQQARDRGEPVRWWPSLGHDPQRRLAAVRHAVEQGRISQEAAEKALPHHAEDLDAALSNSPQLEGPGTESGSGRPRGLQEMLDRFVRQTRLESDDDREAA